jgi:hypothetical protein
MAYSLAREEQWRKEEEALSYFWPHKLRRTDRLRLREGRSPRSSSETPPAGGAQWMAGAAWESELAAHASWARAYINVFAPGDGLCALCELRGGHRGRGGVHAREGDCGLYENSSCSK